MYILLSFVVLLIFALPVLIAVIAVTAGRYDRATYCWKRLLVATESDLSPIPANHLKMPTFHRKTRLSQCL